MVQQITIPAGMDGSALQRQTRSQIEDFVISGRPKPGAEIQGWTLFFDEVQLLFAKRTESPRFNDCAENQQIAYLLQRLEDFPGHPHPRHLAHLDESFADR